jgi:hypothetical protein
MKLRTPFRRHGRRDDEEQGARQDDALIDTPAHSDAVEDADEDVLADEAGPRPTGRFRRLQK